MYQYDNGYLYRYQNDGNVGINFCLKYGSDE